MAQSNLLASIVRLLHLGGEPQLPDAAALEGVRDDKFQRFGLTGATINRRRKFRPENL